ncbi:hypothetical protein QWY20_17025 [Alkalimonas sp. MEB108]|uniref:Uncharacterized protein n=1 Tax=Alkalimonas cellulosilytica TaxID=3058395 RepID=A0ABU7J9F2_9GAMM|nr:hypothetical protein [Alkalimonas sp. MEB108]MEE2003159.1 hypothetical protein [Alkalimonas sp. MEB108]
MSLHSEILKEIQSGKIPENFKLSDLKKRPMSDGTYRVGDKTYGESTLNTMPANLSVDADGGRSGKHVQNGAIPKYIRIARGQYRLICGHEQLHAPFLDDEIQHAIDLDAEPYQFDGKLIGKSTSIPGIVIDYLTQIPFQYYFKKQRIKHPKKPARGLNERLNAYFWPDLSTGWLTTQQEIGKFINEFKDIEQYSDHPTSDGKLFNLFKRICDWGGVKMPDISAPDLKQQVFAVLNMLDKGNVPGPEFKINSAYTKLYAVARPNAFVIFDSRVAAALTSILDSGYEEFSSLPDWSKYSGLGFVNGRGGSRPRVLQHNWKNGYQKWSAQLAANKLCLDIIDLINQKYDQYGLAQPITLREIEAILFMEGY